MLAAAVLLLVHRAAAHGFLAVPLSRNMHSRLYDPEPLKEYTPTQLSAGGIGAVSQGFTRLWPRGNFSVCGNRGDDPAPRWLVPRPIQATYTAGQVIEISVSITADHMGRFAFRLCPSTAVTEDCLNGHWLTRADPVRPGDRYWYLTAKTDGSARVYRGTTGPYTDVATYGLLYRLPSDVTCDNCVLQWWWATGNSCTLPCVEEDPAFVPATGPSSCSNGMAFCGSSTSSWPEEFWNCADIRIRAAGSGDATPTPTPAATAAPTAAATAAPTAAATAAPTAAATTAPTAAATTAPTAAATIAPTAAATSAPTTAATSAPTTAPTTTCPPTTFCAGRATGLYGNPCACDSFISCSGGTTYVQPCPSGLLFNPAVLACDWPANVQCGTSAPATTAPTSTPAPTCSTTSFCVGKAMGLYANPCACDSFISCSGGITYVQPCPSGLRFNANAKVCDWPANVVCG